MSALDCGHEPTPGKFSTGSATDHAGRTMCYPCADSAQAADMATLGTRRISLYLSSDGKNITTWTGGVMARVTEHGASNRAGFYGSSIHYIRARDVDGVMWFGKNGGPGMSITLTRAKVSR